MPRDVLLDLNDGRAFPALVAGPSDGDLVVLLHGFPQDRTAFAPIVDALGAQGRHAVAFDLRGYAPTFRPRRVGDYSVAAGADDVLAVADHLDAERFDVVGHDWGGLVAWWLAGHHGARLRTATSLSTPHPRALATSLLRDEQLLRMAYVLWFNVPLLPEAVLRARGGAALRTMLRRSGLPARSADHYVARMLEPGALAAALAWYRALVRRPEPPPPPATVPTLYVWSSGDPVLRRAAAVATKRFVAAPYRFEVLDGVGHWIPEQAADAVVALLAEHLTRRTPAARAPSRP